MHTPRGPTFRAFGPLGTGSGRCYVHLLRATVTRQVVTHVFARIPRLHARLLRRGRAPRPSPGPYPAQAPDVVDGDRDPGRFRVPYREPVAAVDRGGPFPRGGPSRRLLVPGVGDRARLPADLHAHARRGPWPRGLPRSLRLGAGGEPHAGRGVGRSHPEGLLPPHPRQPRL